MTQFQDDDLVYVDPAAKSVLGLVQFDVDGNPVSRTYEGEGRYTNYPWGSYRAMKKAFRIDGKGRDGDQAMPFDDYLNAVLQDSY